ncbi:MAG: 4-(cytidine 5'-diphospho)-2-C-methyl-D-erythritol kinase [Fimbriimonadaceae bacterium]|nr:4-(cytidine 5'-diphospho)-2-C-methyl-D-erythritol kinase [Fimbriimonadaceae bacterium]
MTLRVLCPAKINTFLAVGPKDSIGYHPIRTIFQAVSLFDELLLAPSTDGTTRIESDWSELPESNTMTKVLSLVREYVNVPPLHIHLTKRIPSESGLGGGSSDAAGLLRGIQELLGNPIGDSLLKDIAFAVGADVPFFLVGGRAQAEGYGEILTPLPDKPTTWIVIARPFEGCSTKEAYEQLDAKVRPWREFPEGDELYNDFERVAPCGSLDLSERLQVLGASGAMMTGSGSAVFGEVESSEAAFGACEKLKAEGSASFVMAARTLGREESLALETVGK